MIDQIVGMILFGLGLQTPHGSAVLGTDDIKNLRVATSAGQHGGLDKRIDPSKFNDELEKHRKEASAGAKTKRDEFQKKLQTLQDTRKKEILSRLDGKIKEIEDRRIKALTGHLNNISEILDKISVRADKLKVNGKDTSVVDAKLADCRNDVTNAQAALTAEAGKQYIITLSSANTAKVDAGATLHQLETDLKAVGDKILTARKCVADSLKELAKISGEKTTP